MFNNFYKNKKVLITGSTGFKGSWLSLWLHNLDANVCGYSLEPSTVPSLFNILKLDSKIKQYTGSILDTSSLEKVFNEFKPEIVFHLAAQPLVRLSYKEPVLTYETNVMGSLNVLEAARKCGSVKAFVNITTDKCYENKENGNAFEEDDAFGGYDPYSASKACVEILSSSYRNSFLQDNQSFYLATARAGNVIGGGDWAQDRLIPDCIRSINNNIDIEIRNPISVRPWQHVLEPLSGYMLLAEKLYQFGTLYAEGFNFGPKEDSILTVADIAQRIINYYGKGKIIIHKKDSLHEANLLMLSIKKAEKMLDWHPVMNVDEAIKNTVLWYQNFYNNKDIEKLTLEQINEYQQKANL